MKRFVRCQNRAHGGVVDTLDAALGSLPVMPVPQADPSAPLTTGKGPGGRWYVKRGREIVTGPFKTEAEAEAAKV